MERPPLANLFAVHDADPAALDEMMLDLQHSGEFAHVWRPAPGWVAAVAPLPGGTPDDDLVRQHQLAFAEGRDVLLERCGQDPVARWREIAELADLHPERLASLPGDFGFIRFRADGDATVVRSCGGLVPFYLKAAEGRCAIGTRLGDFVRYLPDEPRLDPLVNAIWSTTWPIFPDGRTFLDGISILSRGHFARYEANGQAETGKYWDPRPAKTPYPTPAQAEEHAQRLRSLLFAKLERDLDPEGANLLTLSGGVDSSSLAVLIRGVVGYNLSTWTILPRVERPELVAEEMSYIDPLAEQYGFEQRWTEHVTPRKYLDWWREAPDIVFYVLHPMLCSLPRVLKEAPVKVLVGGEFADTVVGSRFTLPDWARQTSLIHLIMDPQVGLKKPRFIARWARQRLSMLRGRLQLPFSRDPLEENGHQNLPLNLYHPAVREAYRDWWDGEYEKLRADHATWRNLAMRTAALDDFIPMNWEACSALGVRRSFPFASREALELAFECHPAELYGPQPGAKRLLRAALHDDVPARNLYRAVKNTRDESLEDLLYAVQEPLPKGILSDELAAVLAPEFFSNPPQTLSGWPLHYATLLTRFVNSLHAQRTGFRQAST